MKKFFVIVSLLLVTMVMLFGCGKTENTTSTGNNNTIQTVDKTGTLQGKIMDAVTGAAISMSASGDQIVLVQGTDDRGPNKLITDANNPLVGEYAFNGIPVQAASTDTKFKVVVIKAGYQRFEADIVVPANTSGNLPLIDNVINMIGNIYLFPIGAVPGTVHVHVLNDHAIPVPGATVLLQQNVTGNNATAIVDDRLTAVGGLYTSMSTTTDVDGVATFNGADFPLVLGGSYIAVVEALEFQGVELKTSPTLSFIIGTNSLHQHISMTAAGSSFFATSATNQFPGPQSIDPTGTITVTFNEPVLMSTTKCDATLANTLSGIITVGTTTFGDGVAAPIIGTLSADGLTFTITIKNNLTTAPSTTSKGATVTYSNCGALILKDSQTSAGKTLFGTLVSVVTDTVVSGTVQLNSF